MNPILPVYASRKQAVKGLVSQTSHICHRRRNHS